MTIKAESITSTIPTLSQKRIFIYFLPLAASWLLMAIEWPFITGAMARLSEAARMIAAFGIVSSVSLVIESPVISLLSTSTALARDRQSYCTIRKFTIQLMIVTTVLHVLMGWTPLYDLVVIDWIGVPESLHEPTRLGLQIMVFWSAAIAWRRFMQGILIRQGLTRFVGIGTIVRLIGSATTAISLALFTDLSGVAVGTLALEVAVISEATFAYIVARKTISEKFSGDSPPINEPTLTYMELVKFHWPLAASKLIFLAARPLVSAALARGLQPEEDLAAWPLLSGLFFLTRAPAVAIPEVVIALHDEEGSEKALSSFTFRVGLVLVAIMVIMGFTPLSPIYFENLIGVTPNLAEIATYGVRFAIILPLVTALLSYLRGVFTARRKTLPITWAMVIELVAMATILFIGVTLKIPGIPLAASTLSIAMGADALYLYITSRKIN
jgi:Na+-driven multidrug efflux pump